MNYTLQEENYQKSMCKNHARLELTEFIGDKYLVSNISPTRIKVQCLKCDYWAIYEEYKEQPVKVLL